MGKLLCEKKLRDVWCRNESVRAEIGQILHTHTHTHTDTCGNHSSIDTSRPTLPKGHFGVLLGVTNSNVLGSCQTAGPIGTNFGSRLRIHLGMDIG